MQDTEIQGPAIVLANAHFRTANAKVAHGLVRGSSRFRIQAVVDPECAGEDAGVLLDGVHRDIPVVSSIAAALERSAESPQFCIVGIATHGGRLTSSLRGLLLEAVRAGLSIVNGLHDAAVEDEEIAAAARRHQVRIVDLRVARPKRELHFWSGEITKVRTPRIAVLGMDCAIGKRTTARFLVDALNAAGTRAEMIYTGQTGWMQGGRYGFVLDSVINDYVSGELEHAILRCEQEARPEVMIIEGQSSLRNPSGPCGAEFLLSGGARGVVLQHAPARTHFEGYEEHALRIPPVADEMRLIAAYGARTLAVTLHGGGLGTEDLTREQHALREALGIPVVRPLHEGVDELVAEVRSFIAAESAPRRPSA